MRKWKCVEVNDKHKGYLTLGKIYETNNEGLDYTIDDGFHFMHLNINELDYGKFEEIKEDENMKREFKVGDKIEILDKTEQKRWATNGAMKKYIGTKGTIEHIYDETICVVPYTIKLDMDGKIWRFNKSDIKLANQPTSKTIIITTSDTITTLTDGTHTTIVNRYHTDKHNEQIAVSSVIDKYYDELKQIEIEKNMPKVGDMVRVVDKGEVYTMNNLWLEENNVPLKTAIKWRYKNSDIKDSAYKVVCIHKHNLVEFEDRMLALIEDGGDAFIMNIEGLEVVR